MSHIHQGPLATYNSLTDNHLSGYFSNGRMRRHLRKAGLVSKQGEIISEATYRLNVSRKEHKKQVKDMLAQAIVHKTLDLERTRQAEIKKKLEEISKIQLVQRVRVLYLDDDGQPITPANPEQCLTGEQSHIDLRHLHTLDTGAIRKYAMLMSQMDEGCGVTSPYMMSQVPLPPKTRLGSRLFLSSRRVQSASPKRPVTTDSKIARLHRPETAKVHPGDQQVMCRVVMKYHGWALNLARERMDPTQEVVVEQQHCGGNTLTVFKERLTPGSTFELISYRHRGYPFSLTLYLDGQMDSRVSTCCEYRHSRGAKIGGKQGHFSLLSVEGAIPCYKCQVAKGLLVRNKAPPRRAKRPSERHMEEVIVVTTKKDDDDDHDYDDDNVTERRTHQGKPAEEESGVVIPVERDGEDKEDTMPTSPASKEAAYDDDFDGEKSSDASYTSASESESETESSAGNGKDEAQRRKRGTEHLQPGEVRGESAAADWEEREAGYCGRTAGAKVNGTGIEIDDYSSDFDEEDQPADVINMENIEADNQHMMHHCSRASSSSSHASSTVPKTTSNIPLEEERGTENTIISIDHINGDSEEKNTWKGRQRRVEERQRGEDEFLPQQQRKTEERREAERRMYQQQLLEQEHRKEEEWKQNAQGQQGVEENRRQITMVLEESDTEYDYKANTGNTNNSRHEENFEGATSENETQKGQDAEESTQDQTRYVEMEVEGDGDEEHNSQEPREEQNPTSHTQSVRRLNPAISPISSAESMPRPLTHEELAAQENQEHVRSANAVMTLLEKQNTADDGMVPPRAPSPFPSPAELLND
ncbi:uncharacterized protein LOC143291186 isoform X2 [Babylonia areolata]|uniref:uncharacterized protein LOC143291186 isoform X2 n=1 Tax=Babylonia areolata TaxID=304850 RepID=UPI003FD14B1A